MAPVALVASGIDSPSLIDESVAACPSQHGHAATANRDHHDGAVLSLRRCTQGHTRVVEEPERGPRYTTSVPIAPKATTAVAEVGSQTFRKDEDHPGPVATVAVALAEQRW